nr:hypothetical protein Iba_chr13eCG12280 [Ipomoea batatas]
MATNQKLLVVFFMVMVALSTTQNAYAHPDIFNFLKKVDDSIKPTKEYSISPKDFDMFGGDVQFQSRKLKVVQKSTIQPSNGYFD